MAPPKKPQLGVVQSSLVQASVAAMQNPMGCEAKTNEHCPLPRLSISSRSASIVASMDAVADGSALHSVMKWKTVLAVFVVVVLYMVVGGLVFQALEEPFESEQKNTITQEKALFLQGNPCVSPAELEALIKVSKLQAVLPEYLVIICILKLSHGYCTHGNILYARIRHYCYYIKQQTFRKY